MSKLSDLADAPRPTDPEAEEEWLDALFAVYLATVLSQRLDAQDAAAAEQKRRPKRRTA